MGFSDDDDKTVYLDYHRDEIAKRDQRIAELEHDLAKATTFLEDALALADQWTNRKWLGFVADFMVNYRYKKKGDG